MGTIWSMDKTTVDAMGAAGQGWMGVMPYRYSYDTDGCADDEDDGRLRRQGAART